MKIEKYLFTENKSISDDQSTSIIEKAKRFKKAFESEKGYSFMGDDFNKFIISLYNSEDEINDELLKILDDTIKKASEYNKNQAFDYRKFYIKLKKSKKNVKIKKKNLLSATKM